MSDLQDLFKDLFYKNVDFQIGINDPCGGWDGVHHSPIERWIMIKSNPTEDELMSGNVFAFECAYDSFVIIKHITKEKHWNFSTISYALIKGIEWKEPVEEKEIPF